MHWPTVYYTSEDGRFYGIACLIVTYIGPAAYSAPGDRRLNGIAFLMLTYIGPAAYSTMGDRRLHDIACLNAHVGWPSHVHPQGLLDIGPSTMLQIVE